jgi:hypothetical protein
MANKLELISDYTKLLLMLERGYISDAKFTLYDTLAEAKGKTVNEIKAEIQNQIKSKE